LAVEERIERQPKPTTGSAALVASREVSTMTPFEDALEFRILPSHVRSGCEQLEIVPGERVHLICAPEESVSLSPGAPMAALATLGQRVTHARIFHFTPSVSNREPRHNSKRLRGD
jgi:hypothetical protein